MMNLRKLIAVSAATGVVALGTLAFAQDDLDDLLKDLEDEVPSVQETPSTDPAPAVDADEPAATDDDDAATDDDATADDDTPAPAPAPAADDDDATADDATADDDTPTPAPAPAADDDDATADDDDATDDDTPAPAPAPAADDDDEDDGEEPVKPAKTADTKTDGAKPAVDSEKAEIIAQIRETEKLRREAYNQQAERELREARKAMYEQDYNEAANHYNLALQRLNDSPKSKKLRRECEQGRAECLYRAALQEERIGSRERALKLMRAAVKMRHPKARRQLEAWISDFDSNKNKRDVEDLKHVRNEDKFKADREIFKKLLKHSRQLLASRQLDKALEECDIVLKNDPYNQEALRLRKQILKKQKVVLEQEYTTTREGMIDEVGKKWRPVYAPNAMKLGEVASSTVKRQVNDDPERTLEQSIIKRMKEMRLPTISFKPPATIIDAIEWFRGASKDYDNPEIPIEKRGFNFVLKMNQTLTNTAAKEEEDSSDFGADDEEESDSGAQSGVPVIPMITASDITLFDALKLVCDSVEYKFKVQGPIVMVMHKNMSVDEMVTRSYPVLASLFDKIDTVSEDMKELRGSGFGGGGGDEESDSKELNWKAVFRELGVEWPEGSSIFYMKATGKLRVKNTYDNLAELEKALVELNAEQRLIEIEARFVEVCQEDLNSLGFEWILNSDYSFNIGGRLKKALGLKNGVFGSNNTTTTTVTESSSTKNTGGTTTSGLSSVTTTSTSTTPSVTQGATWVRDSNGVANNNVGINAMGGDAQFGNTTRYLSTTDNHISGKGNSTNDQFMRINAFLGNADLSMILHMLSQRSDTDLLSAPRVLTRPGEEAVIKVVTEFIYPTDYDVQLQSSSGSSGYSGGSSSSMVLAVVEPQSFTMREVGVILDVTPTLTDDGNLIDLKLNTQVVDEPEWHNYGMKIPFSGNSSAIEDFTGIGEIFESLATLLATLGGTIADEVRNDIINRATDTAVNAMDSLSSSGENNIQYYEAPMEQPFFHVRSIESTVSVNPGSTIVMGGLITEQRKAMDDKIPFLGDLPFIGRLFRSHSEWSSKRNLLIFLTTRLVDVRGREVTLNGVEPVDNAEVKPAPTAQE